MSRSRCARTVVLFAGLVSCSAAHAQFNHGDIMANDYWFRQVTESSNTDATDQAFANAGNMFGAPSVTNNSILFSTPNFYAQATAGPSAFASDSTDGRLKFLIEAKPNAIVSSFSFAERGDYSFAGIASYLGNLTVSCDVQVRVLAINGVGIAPVGDTFSLSFTSGGVFAAPPANQSGNWNGSGGINIDALLALNGHAPRATLVEITLDNKLFAQTLGQTGGGTSRIVKKQGEGIVINVIPAPGAAMLLGLGGLVAVRRRR